MTPDRLSIAQLPLLATASPEEVAKLSRRLSLEHIETGQRLISQGDKSDFFAVVADGEASVQREEAEATSTLATVGAGDVIGELGLLRQAHRLASVIATDDLWAFVGDLEAFEALLDIPGVHDQIQTLVSGRLAGHARPVALSTSAGDEVLLRPMLPTDREPLQRAVEQASLETLRRRFFTTAMPSQRVLDYLVFVDYIDHFAWVCLDKSGNGLGVGRYIRDDDLVSRAEFAFSVSDDYQGRGIGTLLLGAVGVAATNAGITDLRAQFLVENSASKAIFAKAGAEFSILEPGVLQARMSARRASGLISAGDVASVSGAVRDIVRAGGLALVDDVK